MGKVGPFTTAVLIAGVTNVLLSFCFVRYLNMGLKGIILGTICVVVARCALWMPWYVLRCLRHPRPITAPPLATPAA
jgi:Na+-driven multidrug efflux pump